MRALVAFLAVAFALAGCGSSTDTITPAAEPTTEPTSEAANEATIGPGDVDGEWPFSVETGVLRCDEPGAVTFETDGTVYALNGTAIMLEVGADVGESDIWLENPDLPGSKISIAAVLDRGLALCEAG